jgi:hypothetical protein
MEKEPKNGRNNTCVFVFKKYVLDTQALFFSYFF